MRIAVGVCAALVLAVLSFMLAGWAGVLLILVAYASLVVLALRAGLPAAPRPTRRPAAAGVDPAKSFTGFTRLCLVVVDANGSIWAWDHLVRPVLAELSVLAAGRSDVGRGPDRRCAQAEFFGEDLWRWVDPDAPRSQDRSVRGPGYPTLTEILDRLERA
ncbi:MAG: hypothetical protein ACRDQ1_18360 [Sciscionella sp.]